MCSVLHFDDDQLARKAEEELGETDIVKREEMDDLVTWMNQETKVPAITDPVFSLAFLRASKFCQLDAQDRVKRYWYSRRGAIMKHMNGLDPESPDILNILRGPHAVYIPLPGYDREGRKVILARWNQLDVTGVSYTFEDWFKAITLVFDTICFLDPRALINGITILMDAKGVAMKHMMFFGWDNCRKQFTVMQKGYPIRIKQVHYINNNKVISVFLTVVKSVLSTKLSNRIQLHGYEYSSVYDYIDMSNLPKDYLPEKGTNTQSGTTSQDIMERFIQGSILQRDNLKFLKKLYGTDPGQQQDDVIENLTDAVDDINIEDID